jgi:hypothetical protein
VFRTARSRPIEAAKEHARAHGDWELRNDLRRSSPRLLCTHEGKAWWSMNGDRPTDRPTDRIADASTAAARHEPRCATLTTPCRRMQASPLPLSRRLLRTKCGRLRGGDPVMVGVEKARRRQRAPLQRALTTCTC